MVQFNTTVLKFDRQGEKTGWTYIVIPSSIAEKIRPGNKKSFRVKGNLNGQTIRQKALLPMGNGDFILPLNGTLRKQLGIRKGEKLKVRLEEDAKPLQLSPALLSCLADEPDALAYFNTLPPSHRRYYSKWIEDAKSASTQAKRITQAINAFVRKQSFSEMMRSLKKDRNELHT
ncbi:MAG: YdeI/OmpD-associated family protein [Chitinophagales bacterium]|nr:YdeI/OmpD-associated family protein [Chitinophagales bacterium]